MFSNVSKICLLGQFFVCFILVVSFSIVWGFPWLLSMMCFVLLSIVFENHGPFFGAPIFVV